MSSFVASVSTSVLRRHIPKIVPIVTFASMFDEPSNGSNATTYFPLLSPKIYYSYSSVANRHTLLVDFSILTKISSLMMSNFF